jgi:hypothetical protein
MYIFGIVSLLLAGIIVGFFDDNNVILGLMIVPIALMIPGLIFFNRNILEIKDGLLLSALFGFTLTPVYFIVLVVPLSILEAFLFKPANSALLLPGVNWMALVVELVVMGILFTIPTMLSFLICKYVIRNTSKSPRKAKRD